MDSNNVLCSSLRAGVCLKTNSNIQCQLKSDSVLESSPIWGPRPDFCYCQTITGLWMWGALSDERTGMSFTISAGPRPAQLFSGPSPAGPMTIFYCLRFYTHQTWRARSRIYTPGIRWHWVPFSSPLTTGRATVEVFEPASTRASAN
jgi:hypothetical protein